MDVPSLLLVMVGAWLVGEAEPCGQLVRHTLDHDQLHRVEEAVVSALHAKCEAERAPVFEVCRYPTELHGC